MIKRRIAYLYLVIIVIIGQSCGGLREAYISDDVSGWQTQSPDPAWDRAHTLYLVGDQGEIDDDELKNNFVVDAMAEMLDKTDKESTVVYLGDNVYPAGLSKKSESDRKEGEEILTAQLEPIRGHKGETYFIPGNHDWNRHKAGGARAIKRQEKFIENYFDDGTFAELIPDEGCGDPVVKKINKNLVFIFIDSQWWLQDWDKEKDINKGCKIKSRRALLDAVRELFVEYKNDDIIFMMHHPIKSNGNHGGKYSWQDHIFPMHELGVWVPLPVLGSIYPIYRQSTGSKQDITHVQNKALCQGIVSMAEFLRINVTFVAGHEHGLQYFETDRLKYIVSGSGSKVSYLQGGGEADYAAKERGFAKIDFYKNGSAWLTFYTIADAESDPVEDFRLQLRAPKAGSETETVQYGPLDIDSMKITPAPEFSAGGFKRAMLGKQYRDMWTTEVTAPAIDLETYLGGLTPVKKGGGQASTSLRMEHVDGKQYILRGIKKDYTKLIPGEFRELKLIDIIKDQNSASHPYGAIAIPYLSKAAGVYYTSPKLMYLKHQRGLGNYNGVLPEELYLLEERPSGNWSDAAQFGNSEKIISYNDLLEKLRTRRKHFVDQEWVLKSRLFDLWIHDWDRHDDQWRWASFEDGEKTIYRPIPRDRDQAFYKFVGAVPSLVSTFLARQLKTMTHDIADVKNLAFNAAWFDRYFLHDLEWSEWKPVVLALQESVTDEVIYDAFTHIPPEVHHTNNEEITSKLISRRAQLMKAARKLYLYLAEEVEVTGTDHKDLFIAEVMATGHVKLSVFALKKDKVDVLKYQRTFDPSETAEIRLYGLDGKDRFEIVGANSRKINIIIIGGLKKDEVVNSTNRMITVYDEIEGVKLEGNIRDLTSNDIEANEYDREAFTYNTGLPSLNFGYTQDNYFWLGGGYSWTNHGWRKTPYASSQNINFNVAPFEAEAFNFNYNGDFPRAFGSFSFVPQASLNFPYYENYFGLGNDANLSNGEFDYNWVQMQSFAVKPLIGMRALGGDLFFGPTLESYDVKFDEENIDVTALGEFGQDAFDRRYYLGADIDFRMQFVDNSAFPANGFVFNTDFSHQWGLGKSEHVTQLDLSSSMYIMLLAKPQLVLANGLGYQRSWGDLQFHQYADLGNRSGLRGFRNNRFRGTSAFYHNIDLRLSLFNWNNDWLPMRVGILGGYDHGRVWLEDDNSKTYQTSKTVGLWFNILDLVVVQPYYSFPTGEDQAFSLLMGFNF